MNRWFAVARSPEVGPREVVQTQLLGQEIALWRDDVGRLNAWENRCPHRGVRFSIGINTGAELRCQYHGWRFASGSGRCTLIPAHPTQKPASTVSARVFAALERYDYVWVNPTPEATAMEVPTLPVTDPITVRSIFVEAPVGAVSAALLRSYPLDAATQGPVLARDDFILSAAATSNGILQTMVFLLQPVTHRQTVIHGLLQPRPSPSDRLSVLRHHNAQMSSVRDAAERAARDGTNSA